MANGFSLNECIALFALTGTIIWSWREGLSIVSSLYDLASPVKNGATPLHYTINGMSIRYNISASPSDIFAALPIESLPQYMPGHPASI